MFPPKKSNLSMLGVGPKAPPEEAPPPFGGEETAPEEMAEGGCSCPACGAPLQLMAAQMPEEQPEEAAEPPMEQAS